MAFVPSFCRQAAFTIRTGSHGGFSSSLRLAAQHVGFVSARALSKRPETSLASIRKYATDSAPLVTAAASSSSSTQSRRDGTLSKRSASSPADVLDSYASAEAYAPLLSRFERPKSRSKIMTADDFEQAFRARLRRGWATPNDPTSGRSVPVGHGDVQGAYRILGSILKRNNIRGELRLGERYEKPNQMRRRKASERHRRRFADMIRKKVQLVMQKRRRGE
ncbi:hypothetical protein K437DRAFT_293524 [Tilletiaria anomala UBC 951]|uniref:Ribosomal protein S21 n=1 Tax=Tilletiaria anomala (strain ATCC 24038 / CBS 436.72 / UBC 951) TaxID=1037660 RepID=A0A066WIH3_TILAU|nr:uncharacterized protein K437DRAFT_293524 [Tilletiaria anomala UBC 951]KDN50819.1 hypothetical protein K437DRAFT_293524 [Tilletiaria anomala UBC 951]